MAYGLLSISNKNYQAKGQRFDYLIVGDKAFRTGKYGMEFERDERRPRNPSELKYNAAYCGVNRKTPAPKVMAKWQAFMDAPSYFDSVKAQTRRPPTPLGAAGDDVLGGGPAGGSTMKKSRSSPNYFRATSWDVGKTEGFDPATGKLGDSDWGVPDKHHFSLRPVFPPHRYTTASLHSAPPQAPVGAGYTLR
eukprot:TRINITY_DN93878_c0_g1_i1.p1 TRINITY_DN93878_c0_g1~~TRINITY_DN93878_c0_g1_i1.p1  ORF type:complete len:216 (-),score=38.55 TRINITY_DN93878_c0_g1_i1:135-710(-)